MLNYLLLCVCFCSWGLTKTYASSPELLRDMLWQYSDPVLISANGEYRITKDFQLSSNRTRDILGVDAIYVTHWSGKKSEAQKKRKDKLTSWLLENKLDSLWILDFDGNELDCPDIQKLYPLRNQKLSKKRLKRVLGLGEISLFLKHAFIYSDMLSRGFNVVLILEDDAVFTQDILAIRNRMTSVSDIKWGLINSQGDCYGGRESKVDSRVDSGIYFAEDHVMRCAHAYFLRQSAAGSLLDTLFADNTFNMHLPIDNHITEIARNVPIYYFKDPIPIRQNAITSDRHHMVDAGPQEKNYKSCFPHDVIPILRKVIYLNGHSSQLESNFAAMLFSDFDNDIKMYSEDILETHPNDIMLVGMHGPMKGGNMSSFRGKILYFNGETDMRGIKLTAKNTFYLGPTSKEDEHHMKFYYASFAMMFFAPMIKKNEGDTIAFALTTTRSIRTEKTHFLQYIQSNCQKIREDAFDSIVKHMAIISPNSVSEAGGNCFGHYPNLHKPLSTYHWAEITKPSPFRFELCMDRLVKPGYITEKIVRAFIQGSVPIYYGTKEVFQLFNEDAFIFYDIDYPQKALDLIAYYERNATAYAEIASRPILAVGALEKYFSLDDDIGGGLLKYQIRKMMSLPKT